MKSLTPLVADSAVDFKVPRGSEAVGDRARLPAGAEEPITVFVNGVEQRRDVDYRIEGDEVVFARPILKESKLGFSRWVAIYLGIFGTYRIHESVDIHYMLNGELHSDGDVTLYGKGRSESAAGDQGRSESAAGD